MTTAPTTRLTDHWWWRPGWRSGRRMWTWHVTFDGASDLHRLAAAHRPVAALHGVEPATARVRVSEVQLIRLGRDEHVYRWDDARSVPLGP